MPLEVYARDVLPLTAPLWSGRRTFEQYLLQTSELARSPYGRRHYRTIGLYDGATCVASFKRYERTLRNETRRVRAIGFGAVFTPAELRGRGYASFMLASALDSARSEGYDIGYLFCDIRPQFYLELGFRVLPSRRFTLRSDTLPSERLTVSRLAEGDWAEVRRIFAQCEGKRRIAFLRPASVWDWVAMRLRHGSEHRRGDETNLVMRQRGRIVAYVLGMRDPTNDAYIVDEYAFARDGRIIAPLLRAAAGDLRRVTGWLPPGNAREHLPRCTVRTRQSAIAMAAPLRQEGVSLVRSLDATRADFCWATDHI